jgi:imidazolonepropionase-like amidohydrolase
MKKILLAIILSGAIGLTFGQKPASPQSQKIIIKNATIHVGNGTVIEKGSIQFEKGKITAIGTTALDEANAKVIDASGKHVYPGLIAPYSKVGLEEVEAVRATLDYNEVGDINANVRSLIAYNTDSKIIPTLRSNGVLTVLTVPQGGSIPGMSSLMKLEGWNWEDAVYSTDIAMHFDWPSMRIYNAWWAPPADEQRKQSAAALEELKNFFAGARVYLASPQNATKNLKYEAMRDVFTGKRKLIIYASTAKEITSAVLFAEEFGIKPIIAGASDATSIIPFLKDHSISLILEQSHALPNRDDDDVDAPYRRAATLHAAGIPFCMGIEGSWQQRNLPFMAGTNAAYGMSKEDALKGVTLDAAKIFGVEKTLGSLELNKDATLLISEGDLLDMKSSVVTAAFIQGAEIDLDNKQKELNKRYEEKYQIK